MHIANVVDYYFTVKTKIIIHNNRNKKTTFLTYKLSK